MRRRRPGFCLIDGLAYSNPAGSRNRERWQDVEDLLAAGISVLTTINLQYVKEKQEQVEAIRGKRVRDSVPERFIRQADEIEIVDAPADQFPELREIALLLTAEVVDHQLEIPLRGAHERILVCVTPRSNAHLMIARGRRQAEIFHGELFAVYVEQDYLSAEDRKTLEENLEEARRARAQVAVLRDEDPVRAILRFADQKGITQIFVGHSQRGGWLRNLRPNPVERLILEADGIDIRVFPNGGGAGYRRSCRPGKGSCR